MGVLIEASSCSCIAGMGKIVKLRITLEYWCRFLTRAWGKVFMYLWLAVGCVGNSSFIWVVFGKFLFCFEFSCQTDTVPKGCVYLRGNFIITQFNKISGIPTYLVKN